jgi:hypothetical protein
VYSPGATTGTTQARRIFNVLNPAAGKYFGSTAMVDDGGNASYNGLLVSANRRFSHGFSALANYTWSYCFNQGDANQDIGSPYQNPNNRKAEWGACSSDLRQLFNLSVVAESPRLGSEWTRRATGGWQISGIFSYRTGAALNVLDGTDVSLTGGTNDRPDNIASTALSSPTIARWFNTAAFQKQAAGTYGNSARDNVRGPAVWTFDTSLSRTFQLLERFKMNFRFEAFNLLNHARWGNPVTTLSSSTFGQITTAMDPRILQVAMKFQF